ncbi:MAG TPA: SRPBCC family protein, partial [Gemmatimonadales bacterium]
MNCWLTERKRRRRRRRVLRAGAAGLALTGVLSLLGLFLPAERVTTARGTFDRPPEAVWRVLTDLDGMALWRSDLVRIERLPDLDGRLAWREVGLRGDRVVELAVADPPVRLVLQGRE